MTIEIINPDQKEAIAKNILLQLPEWFGVPESTISYITGVKDKPFWATYMDDTPIGFIALKETSPATAEIYVMGVLPERHRSGAGRALYEAFENYAQEKDYSFIQVKTVRKGYWASYDETNKFYVAMGFKELECFPDYWDKSNPCQIYIKAI